MLDHVLCTVAVEAWEQGSLRLHATLSSLNIMHSQSLDNICGLTGGTDNRNAGYSRHWKIKRSSKLHDYNIGGQAKANGETDFSEWDQFVLKMIKGITFLEERTFLTVCMYMYVCDDCTCTTENLDL